MNNHKLHQWVPVLMAIGICTSCSQKELPGNNNTAEEKYENTKPAKALPPQVITVDDTLAQSTKEGEMYYDDKDGYRYWRLSDGRYALDEKYQYGAKPNKKLAKKKMKQQQKEDINTDYVHQNT